MRGDERNQATRWLLSGTSVATALFILLDVIFANPQPLSLTLGRAVLFGTFGPASVIFPRLGPRGQERLSLLLAASLTSGVALICIETGGVHSPGFAFVWSSPLLIAMMFIESPKSPSLAGGFALAWGAYFLSRDGQPASVIAYWTMVTVVVAVFASVAAYFHRRAHLAELEHARRAEQQMQERDRALQAQLAVTDRMSALGTMAAGMAHDINNPLAFVLSNLRYACETLTAPEHAEVRDALQDALSGAERVRAIVHDLKAFSRSDDTPLGPVDLQKTMESAVTLAWNEIRHRARLVRDYGDVPTAFGSETRLGQVFLNLLINAAQAIPEGCSDENEITIRLDRTAEGAAVIEVRDTGSGIPPHIKPRIFEPFFTTKPRGVGTGLGLSICHGIIAQHDGAIAVEDAPGGGTLFRITLPAFEGPKKSVAKHDASVRCRRAKVVVIDDDPLIISMLERTLGKEHDLRVFTEADPAIGWVLAYDDWDVVLSDVMMPGTSGLDVYRVIAAEKPHRVAQIVFMTGGAFTDAAQAFLSGVSNQVVDKTSGPDELRMAIARVVATLPPPGAHRVLVVDDEPQILTALSRVLQRAGFAVATAGSGPDALRLLPSFAPHVVVSDYRMTPMDGAELLARVAEERPSAARIMLSAHAEGHASDSAAGFVFVSKPWSDEALVETIRSAVQRRAAA